MSVGGAGVPGPDEREWTLVERDGEAIVAGGAARADLPVVVVPKSRLGAAEAERNIAHGRAADKAITAREAEARVQSLTERLAEIERGAVECQRRACEVSPEWVLRRTRPARAALPVEGEADR